MGLSCGPRTKTRLKIQGQGLVNQSSRTRTFLKDNNTEGKFDRTEISMDVWVYFERKEEKCRVRQLLD